MPHRPENDGPRWRTDWMGIGKPRWQSGKAGEPFDQRDQRSLDRRVWRINKISDEEAVPRSHATEPSIIRNIIIAQHHYHTSTKNDTKHNTSMATSNQNTNSKHLDTNREKQRETYQI